MLWMRTAIAVEFRELVRAVVREFACAQRRQWRSSSCSAASMIFIVVVFGVKPQVKVVQRDHFRCWPTTGKNHAVSRGTAEGPA